MNVSCHLFTQFKKSKNIQNHSNNYFNYGNTENSGAGMNYTDRNIEKRNRIFDW